MVDNRNTYSSSIYDTNSEYFNRKKEINAYKYPQVCVHGYLNQAIQAWHNTQMIL